MTMPFFSNQIFYIGKTLWHNLICLSAKLTLALTLEIVEYRQELERLNVQPAYEFRFK